MEKAVVLHMYFMCTCNPKLTSSVIFLICSTQLTEQDKSM